MELQTRKANRLSGFDYSGDGYYFITICTANKQKIFGTVVGERIALPKESSTNQIVGERIALPKIKLSNYGKIVEKSINNISKCYDGVFVNKYVIMPNHLHLIIIIKRGSAMRSTTSESAMNTATSGSAMRSTTNESEMNTATSGSAMRSPTVSNIIGQMKSYVTKQVGIPIWQKSFYDHIIRDEDDYLRIAEYIENNPAKWSEDKYFA